MHPEPPITKRIAGQRAEEPPTDEFTEIDLPDRRGRWISAFTIGIVAAYALPWLAFLGRVGPRDYDQFLVFHELQYWSASLFGLAKQWTPVMCAGLSLAGEPQVPFLSLSMALSYALGPLPGLEAATAAYFVLGWCGAWLYAGLWLRRFEQRALAASLFVGNGFFVCRFGFGHIDFIPFLSLPLALWALHRSAAWARERRGADRALPLALATLLMGAGISLAIDGSPSAIIYLLFWIALYAAVLSVVLRSAVPFAVLSVALALAAVLDAGYLWPMLVSQAEFPRRTADSFTNPLALPWFMLLPLRRRLFTPVTGRAHELSVFIGPVIAYLLWRYRSRLAASLPTALKRPLLVVSVVSIVLGMGSLRALHVPAFVSPFDWLRPLPGFRSLFVTGRYWGFLALPLSLLGAAALWRFVAEHPEPKRLRVWMVFALLVQLGFQVETILSHWLPGHRNEPIEFQSAFRHGAEDVTYVRSFEAHQGKLITPTRGVVNCYDKDDFLRADIEPGAKLVKAVLVDGAPAESAVRVSGKFLSWSRIRISLSQPLDPAYGAGAPGNLRIVLNQAYHPHWHSPACRTSRNERGNLILECRLDQLRDGPIDLEFRDPVSDLGADVSRVAWPLWFVVAALVLPLTLWIQRT